MSDPLERFRSVPGGSAPDLDAIRGRARAIRRRRYTGLSAGAAALAALAVAGILVTGGPSDRAAQLAQRAQQPAEHTGEADPVRAPGGGVPERADAVEQAPGRAVDRDEGGAYRSGESGPGGADREAAAPGDAASAPARAGAQENGEGVVVSLRVAERPRGASFTLRACNASDEAVDVTFPSGQRYDFEVHRDGELVWRWSDGRAFTMVYGTERMEAGDCRTYTDSWDGSTSDGPAAPGGYEAVGVLSSDPPRRSAAQAFCLDACE